MDDWLDAGETIVLEATFHAVLAVVCCINCEIAGRTTGDRVIVFVWVVLSIVCGHSQS
jgi:hypothetical protein